VAEAQREKALAEVNPPAEQTLGRQQDANKAEERLRTIADAHREEMQSKDQSKHGETHVIWWK
jgi:hypothetical protein